MSKESERNARRAAIEAMTAELMQSNPTDVYNKIKANEPIIAPDNSGIDSMDVSTATNIYGSKSLSHQSTDSFAASSISSSSQNVSNKLLNIQTQDRSMNEDHTAESDNDSVDEQAPAESEQVDIDEFASTKKIPISHEANFTGHTKAVTALSIDGSGTRVVTGSLDYNVKIYDFGGMDSRFRAFKSFEPHEGHPITSIYHSPIGDRFIIGTGGCQPKVFDRDGNLIITFVRGDMYIRDMSNTKGHTMEVTGVCWHPLLKDVVISSSLDGTVRIWDLLGEAAFGNLINKHVLKIRSMSASASGQTRIGATCCFVSSNGKYYVAGASDGSVHIWQERKIYSRADTVIKSAHGSVNIASNVTAVLMTQDCSTLISRGEDGMIKVWDIKKPQAAVRVFQGCNNMYPSANIALSPDNTILVCGVGEVSGSAKQASKDEDSISKSSLCFFDLSSPNSAPCMQIGLKSCGTAIRVTWAATTNQILCSTSTGAIKIFYDPKLSNKGALLSVGKPVKRLKEPSDFAIVGEIINPHALPLFRNDSKTRHKRLRELKDSTVPEKPKTQGPGTRLNTSFFFTQYVTDGKKKDHLRDEDPREALLKMDSKAKANPAFFGKAYQETQPKTVLTSITFEEEQEEFIKKQKTQL